ncbi:MobF family relaxase, partial [Escherichia coli]
MMSIAQVRSAGSAGNYYTDKDNYYVLGSMGERWAGRGAEQLGLQGSVDKDVFTRLLEGKLPDGADLSRMQDGSNKHRPGYDLTFSAPKSVSVMAMLGGDKRLIDAHNQAVDFAVRQVEALGYETEVVGKHGMWEMPGVPVEAFSGRSQAIREAVGEDASLKSRDVAALDTRKSKQHVDPEVRMAEWMQTLKETGFDIRA